MEEELKINEEMVEELEIFDILLRKEIKINSFVWFKLEEENWQRGKVIKIDHNNNILCIEYKDNLTNEIKFTNINQCNTSQLIVSTNKPVKKSVELILNIYENKWNELINSMGDNAMAEEIADITSDKKTSNAFRRIKFVNNLVDQLNLMYGFKEINSSNEDDFEIMHVVDKYIDCIGKLNEISPYLYECSSSSRFGNKAGKNCVGIKKGNFGFEVEIMTDNEDILSTMSIGYADSDHSLYKLVGEDSCSYGWNGYKGKLYNCKSDYGIKGNNIGMYIDIDNKYIEYCIDGKWLDKAFTNINLIDNTAYILLTLYKEMSIKFITEKDNLKYLPNDGREYNLLCDIPDCMDINSNDSWNIPENVGMTINTSEDNNLIISSEKSFPTAQFKQELTSGKFYCEVEVINKGDCCQFGFGTKNLQYNINKGEGCGDDNYSWGFDPVRLTLFGKSGAQNYPLIVSDNDDDSKNNEEEEEEEVSSKWKKGDIIGCELYIKNKYTSYIKYYLNGKDLGIAFNNIDMSKHEHGLFPSVSAKNETGIQFMYQMREKYFDVMIKSQKGEITQEEAKNELENFEKMKPKDEIYFKLNLDKNNFKYLKNDNNEFLYGISDCIQYYIKNIINGLPNYSVEQYKKDIKFLDNVIEINSINEFDDIINNSNIFNKLIFVDFYATWCGPCKYIAPHIHELADKYMGKVLFLKVDVDKIKELSKREGVKCMPTFKLYKNGNEIENTKLEGANIDKIKERIIKYSGNEEEEE